MNTRFKHLYRLALAIVTASGTSLSSYADNADLTEFTESLNDFTDNYCYDCHNDDEFKGRFDFDALPFKLDTSTHFDRWVKVFDRLKAGEMPPKEENERPSTEELDTILATLERALDQHDSKRVAQNGRAVQRRLNSYEYENALRDLLDAPWLQLRDKFPEDGEMEHFNKVGNALDVSHVHMARYMEAANHAIRQTLGVEFSRRPAETQRHYAREQRDLVRSMLPRSKNVSPHRTTYPVLDIATPQPDVRRGIAPLTAGPENPELRNREAVGWSASNYVTGFSTEWDNFKAPVSANYRIRLSGFTQRVAPNGFPNYPPNHKNYPGSPSPEYPNYDLLYPGDRDEPISVYANGSLQNRRLGTFDLTPEPAVYDLGEHWLFAGENLVTDATRLFRSRPGWDGNPLMTEDGAPAVAFRWIEIEGPLYDEPVSKAYRLLFGDLPMQKIEDDSPGIPVPVRVENESGRGKTENIRIEVVSKNPRQDAARLLRAFLDRAYRRPVTDHDLDRYLQLYDERRDAGLSFSEALTVCYTAVLASPSFVFVDERPGPLSAEALATRLSLFLWNSPPTPELLAQAADGKLRSGQDLRRAAEQMLADPRATRFREAFLDYWLDLRKINDSSPSSALYNDYYVDEALVEAAIDETRLTFEEMIKQNLPVRTIVDADFAFLNERLAEHYDIPGVKGVAMRRVSLPPDSVRGGLLTQASVLKVTANGTTTSPVLRGVWIVERIMGVKIPPPPPVDAVEPDIRGAVTIRQQLEKHRDRQSCAACHQKMDPPGFALESFDIMGGFRDRYRALDESKEPVPGIGKNGHRFKFHYGLDVDSAGELPDGRAFSDIREFKSLLREENDLLAENLIEKFVIYGTGAPIGFSDRPEIERILDRVSKNGYGIRDIILEVIDSPLFRQK